MKLQRGVGKNSGGIRGISQPVSGAALACGVSFETQSARAHVDVPQRIIDENAEDRNGVRANFGQFPRISACTQRGIGGAVGARMDVPITRATERCVGEQGYRAQNFCLIDPVVDNSAVRRDARSLCAYRLHIVELLTIDIQTSTAGHHRSTSDGSQSRGIARLKGSLRDDYFASERAERSVVFVHLSDGGGRFSLRADRMPRVLFHGRATRGISTMTVFPISTLPMVWSLVLRSRT